ncbi:unnamed protein product [Paramecium primaurelia]|uniref:Kinesin-like protein n=1 Tax=Paramecium primaurelia TaxID=5886 RepID=A0A8S1PJR2_PARPR|nr:unnamed protein product [Paramecium primaurelia]
MKKESECVKVVVRVRPFNQREKENNSKPCVNVDEKQNVVELLKPVDNESKQFSYDYVFGMNAKQSYIYEKTAFNLVESVIDGYNGTIFAYGQTGCGKTFTMTGVPENEELKGIIPRTFTQIQTIIDTNTDTKKKFLVRCSFLEIYNEEIRDLLGKDHKARLELKESQGCVSAKDLTMVTVKTAQEMDKYMSLGQNNRSVGATAMNAQSSRSHCIFTVYVESQIVDAKGNEFIRVGKLNLVDLAGSERQSKTQATGDRLKEATKINLSLSALGNVISALVDGKTQHIPYRDSKLTRLLQDSLGGNTKTVMITALSPADFNYDETLSSLRYASRAKMIKNQPKINEDPKDALLKQQADEIQKLKEQLSKLNKNGGGGGSEKDIQNNSSSNFYGNLKKQQEILEIEKIKSDEVQKELEKLKQDNERLIKERKDKEEQMSRQKQRELEQLIKDNENLQKEKEKVLEQIAEKEQKAIEEQNLRQKLQELMAAKEKMVVTGGKASEEEKKKYRLQQKKLKQQSQEHEKLLEEREKQKDELYDIEQKYQSVQEEIEALRKKNLRLRKVYKEAMVEIKDIQKENEQDKEELLESIRALERENTLYLRILLTMFKEDELLSLKGDCVYDEDKKDYKVPPFVFKQNKVSYPSLPYKEAQEYIEELKDQRQLQINPKQDMLEIPARNNSKMRSEEIQQRSSSQGFDKQNRQQQMLKQQQQQVQELEKLYPTSQTPQLEKKQKVQLSPIENNKSSRPQSNQQNDQNIFKQSPLKKQQELLIPQKPTSKIPLGKLPPDIERKNHHQ